MKTCATCLQVFFFRTEEDTKGKLADLDSAGKRLLK